MTEKEYQQVEAIMKVINECCNVYDKNGRHLRNKCNSADCEYWSDENYCCCSYGRKEAEAIYNAGYRLVPDGAVVLTKEEKKKLLHEMYEQGKFDAIAELKMDGKVVLATEKLELGKYKGEVQTVRMARQTYDACLMQARKETAKEFAEKLKYTLTINNEENTEFFDYQYTLETIDEIAKQCGVEVDE